MGPRRSNEEWLCKICLGRNGQPYQNHAFRDRCHGGCGLAKGPAHLRNAPPATVSTSASERARRAAAGNAWQSDRTPAEKEKEKLAQERKKLAQEQAKLERDRKQFQRDVNASAARPVPAADLDAAADDMDTEDDGNSIPNLEAALSALSKIRGSSHAEVVLLRTQLDEKRAAKRAARPWHTRLSEANSKLGKAINKLAKANESTDDYRAAIVKAQKAMQDHWDRVAELQAEVDRARKWHDEVAQSSNLPIPAEHFLVDNRDYFQKFMDELAADAAHDKLDVIPAEARLALASAATARAQARSEREAAEAAAAAAAAPVPVPAPAPVTFTIHDSAPSTPVVEPSKHFHTRQPPLLEGHGITDSSWPDGISGVDRSSGLADTSISDSAYELLANAGDQLRPVLDRLRANRPSPY